MQRGRKNSHRNYDFSRTIRVNVPVCHLLIVATNIVTDIYAWIHKPLFLIGIVPLALGQARVWQHPDWVIERMVMLLGRVVLPLVEAGDHGVSPHIAVILVAGVEEVAVEEERVSRLHLYMDKIKCSLGIFHPLLVGPCLVACGLVIDPSELVAAFQDLETAVGLTAPICGTKLAKITHSRVTNLPVDRHEH